MLPPQEADYIFSSCSAGRQLAVMSFLNLHGGKPRKPSKQTFIIAGLPVHVYSGKTITERSGPVAILFFLHGRTGTAKSIEWAAEDAIKAVEVKRKKDKSALDLVVVTIVSGFDSTFTLPVIYSSRTNETTETG